MSELTLEEEQAIKDRCQKSNEGRFDFNVVVESHHHSNNYSYCYLMQHYNTGRMRFQTRFSSPCKSSTLEVMTMTAFLSGTTMMY